MRHIDFRSVGKRDHVPRERPRKGPAMHDAYRDHSRVEGPSDRAFGLTVGAILVGIAVFYRTWGDGTMPGALWIGVPGAVLILFAAAAPRLLAPLNRLWMKLGLLLAAVVNPLVMLLMFAVLFVPIAVAMRLFGRDALRLRRDQAAESYWIVRDPPGPEPQSIVNQF